MTIQEAIRTRHSVRSYQVKNIEGEVKDELIAYINMCNKESGLHMQLILNEAKCFDSKMAKYGGFKNVLNYIAVVGDKNLDLKEKCGYYGEKVVLKAQQLGLNTCWVALTFNKSQKSYKMNENEKLYVMIVIGYGETKGKPHNCKEISKVMKVDGQAPKWFKDGVDAALLAPTALNQQKFKFILQNNKVEAKAGFGPYVKMDLGIVKYHFEIGAGKENFEWA